MRDSSFGQKILSAFGILGAFLVVAFLLVVMKGATPAPSLGAARIQERKTALAEIRDSSAKAINSYEVIDPNKKLVRLAIDRAMELTIEEYKNPAAARSNLVARAEKASEPPPKPPEQPSKYE
jgi:hypothetical protein